MTSCSSARVPSAARSWSLTGRLGPFLVRPATIVLKTGSWARTRSNCFSRLGADDAPDLDFVPDASAALLASRVAWVWRLRHSLTSQVHTRDESPAGMVCRLSGNSKLNASTSNVVSRASPAMYWPVDFLRSPAGGSPARCWPPARKSPS